VELGRRDALTTSKDAATNAIPKPTFTVPELIASFSAVGLDEKDVVSLSGTKPYLHPKKELSIAELGNPNSVLNGCPGSHTIGKARCTSFQARLYNQGNTGQPDPSLEKPYLAELQRLCPQDGDGNVTAFLDPCTPVSFDNQYYKDVVAGKGLLFSDAALETTAGTTRQLVQTYADDQASFFRDFAASMLKMGASRVLSGPDGEVRHNCRIPNTQTN
jgi:peroxidase